MNRPFPIQPVVSLAAPQAKGMDFVRAARALAMAGEDGERQAVNIAKSLYGDDSRVVQCLKTAVGAVENADLNTTPNPAATEFLQAVRDRSVIGQLAGLRRRPAATRYLINQGRMTGSWVAEGHGIPVLGLSFDQAHLGLLKVASICVFTDESLRAADAGVEASIRQDMVDGLAQSIDTAFLDPANAGVSGEEPASITYGLDPVAVGTGALDDVRQGISTMIAEFQGDLSRATFLGRPELFAMMRSQGWNEELGIRGGTLFGAPAIATRGLPNSSGNYYQLVLVDPGGVGYVDDPAATSIVASQQAAIEMSDAPTGDGVTPTAANLVSLWQAQATAIRSIIYANWAVEQTAAVSLAVLFPVADVS